MIGLVCHDWGMIGLICQDWGVIGFDRSGLG